MLQLLLRRLPLTGMPLPLPPLLATLLLPPPKLLLPLPSRVGPTKPLLPASPANGEATATLTPVRASRANGEPTATTVEPTPRASNPEPDVTPTSEFFSTLSLDEFTNLPQLAELNYDNIKPAQNVDYWELRFAFPGETAEVVGARGSKDGIDPDLLLQFDVLTVEEGFDVECLPSYCFKYIASISGCGLPSIALGFSTSLASCRSLCFQF